MAIKQGYVEILDNYVRVLTDQAERGQEIDAAQAEKDLREAQAAYVNPALAMDIASWLIAAKHAQARLDAARKAAAGGRLGFSYRDIGARFQTLAVHAERVARFDVFHKEMQHPEIQRHCSVG